jgi:hypothetical protein
MGKMLAQNYNLLHQHEWENLQVKWHFWHGYAHITSKT